MATLLPIKGFRRSSAASVKLGRGLILSQLVGEDSGGAVPCWGTEPRFRPRRSWHQGTTGGRPARLVPGIGGDVPVPTTATDAVNLIAPKTEGRRFRYFFLT
jgi:hypothetical protein